MDAENNQTPAQVNAAGDGKADKKRNRALQSAFAKIEKKSVWDFLRTVAMLTLGALLMSTGSYFFKFPNNFAMGGVNGIAILASTFIPGLSTGNLDVILNLILLVIGFLLIGRDFGAKTVYTVLAMSGFISLFGLVCPLSEPLTHQPLLEWMFAVVLPALGSAILFYNDASSGGTDIVAMIIKKFTHINISTALLCADAVIVMSVLFIFGVETWLFSVLGFLAKTLLVNRLLLRINLSKYCTVITSPENEEVVCRYITEVLHKSATVDEGCVGAYSHEKKTVILTALTTRQTVALKKFVKAIDGKSFVIVTDTSEISGKGFKETI